MLLLDLFDTHDKELKANYFSSIICGSERKKGVRCFGRRLFCKIMGAVGGEKCKALKRLFSTLSAAQRWVAFCCVSIMLHKEEILHSLHDKLSTISMEAARKGSSLAEKSLQLGRKSVSSRNQ